MSVVLCYADEKMTILASDGRVVDKYNNTVREDFDKTRKINDHVLMGFAGDANVCQTISDLITNPKKKDFVSLLYVEQIIGFIEDYFKTMPKNINCKFIVSGIGKRKRICVGNISTYQPKEITYPERNCIVFQGLYPKEIPNDTDYFKELLMRQNPREAIKSMIQICAKLSPTVNEKMFCKEVDLS